MVRPEELGVLGHQDGAGIVVEGGARGAEGAGNVLGGGGDAGHAGC